jgi:uncharacterized repeat protein (TIGR01451 family)
MNKSKRRLIALISAFSILINSISFWSPLLVLAQENPEPTPVVEMTPEPTVEPTSDPQTNYNTPTPEVTIAPSPSDSFQKEDQLNQTPIPGPSPLADYEPFPSATPLASLANEPVDKVCLSQGEEIKDTVNEDWEINFEEGWAKTKEPVKLGIKYLFPQENKVSVTFKCLPKEGTTQLKIQKVKVSDLKLPEGVNPYGEYAYDITTEMTDGTFEYDMTLPKPQDKSVNVSYMEDKYGEIKQIGEEKVNEEGDKVRVEGIDHFTIYFVESNYITIKVEPVSYLQGEIVYLMANSLTPSKYYRFYLDPPGGGGGGGEFPIGSCQSGSATTITESYTLSPSADTGTWTVKLYQYNASNCTGQKQDAGHKDFTVNQSKADLVITKTNNVGGITKVSQVFKWTLRVTNQGTARADFGKNETVLIDNLPDSGVTYGSPVVENVTNVSQVGGINCSISAAKDLTCKTGNANGNYVYIEVGGYFDVSIDVTPSASTLLENPRGGRGGDTCQVDPDNKVPESQDKNNNCSDSVFVTLADGNCNICANGGKPGWLVLRLETISGVIKVKAGNGPGDPVIFNQSVNQGSTFTINGDKADGTFSKNDLYFYKDDNLVGKIHVSCSKDIISGQSTDEDYGGGNGTVDFKIIQAHNQTNNLTCPISTPTPTPTPAPYCGDEVKNGNEECDGTAGIPQGAENEIRCNNRCQFELIEPKVDICHATNSNQNPYVENQPNKSGDVSGHDGHNGSIWYPGINTSWGDIIPPFWYLDNSNNPKQYTGKNWDSNGQAILNNGCKIPYNYCGDGVKNQESEQCDDGNNVDGDGCSSTCQIEYGSVSGYKYGEDGETGLPGWTIFIDENKNRILDGEEINVQTDKNGYFEFTGLTAGIYSICEVEQSGWQRMYPSGTNCQSVTITSGSEESIYFQNREVVLGLSLTKSNSAVSALSSGSEVTYTLVIKNTGNQRLTGVTIKDAPSGGFSYVNGSGLLEGNPITPTALSGYLEWYIDTLEASGNEGDTKTLTYKMVTSSDLPSGVYPNIAIATGVYIPYEHEGNEEVVGIFEPVEVLAVSEDTESGERVESNAGMPVNSQVELKQVLAYSTGVGVVGQVLGAATEAEQVLPAAGSDTRFFVFAIAALIFGLFLKFGSFALNKNWIDYRRLKKGLKNIFASILFLLVFSLFAPFAKAFSDYVSITKLSSYINKEDFKISYSALSENPISAQFYVKKDGDSSWRTLGSALTGASGYVQVSGGDIYNGDGKYFFKVVINGGTAEDETSTIVDRQAPDVVHDYRKGKLGDGHYKLYWRNPDNEDFDKVIIYRSDSTNFTADSSTEVATIWGSKDTEMTSENAAAPGKEYYFAIRAIDKAGNASSVVSDPETQVSAGSVLGASVSATSTPEVVKILPKEKKTGEVLGEEKTEEATPSPTLTPQEEKGGVLGQAVKFAKDRTKLTVGIIAVLLFASYLGLRKFRSGEKK